MSYCKFPLPKFAMFLLLQRESVDLAIDLLDESEYKGSVIHVEQVRFVAFFTENFIFQTTVFSVTKLAKSVTLQNFM